MSETSVVGKTFTFHRVLQFATRCSSLFANLYEKERTSQRIYSPREIGSCCLKLAQVVLQNISFNSHDVIKKVRIPVQLPNIEIEQLKRIILGIAKRQA